MSLLAGVRQSWAIALARSPLLAERACTRQGKKRTGPVIDILRNPGMMVACLEQHEQRRAERFTMSSIAATSKNWTFPRFFPSG